MSRKKSSTQNSVSLFPFLAVLLCAMGALVLLLLINTHRMRQQVVAEAKLAEIQRLEEEQSQRAAAIALAPKPVESSPAPEPPPPPIDPNIELKARVDELADIHRIKHEALQQRQAIIRAAHDKVAETQDSLDASQAKLAQLRGQRADAEKINALASEKAKLDRQILEMRTRIAELEKQPQTADSKYTIIPYDGRFGTVRRPILVECSSTGLRFLPEDILLTSADLDGFTVGYNPFLAGADALLNYWQEQNMRSGGEEPEPYILLLVRPSGSVAYYAARKLLSRLDQPMGYELIDEDWELDLPEADPQAVAVCRQAIDEMKSQKKLFLDQMADTAPPEDGPVRLREGGGKLVVERVEQENKPPEFARILPDSALAGGRRPEFEPRSNVLRSADARRGQGNKNGEEHGGEPGEESTSSDEESPDERMPEDAWSQRHTRQSSAQQSAPSRENPGEPVHISKSSKQQSAEQPVSRPSLENFNMRSQSDRSKQAHRWGFFGSRASIGFEREIVVRSEADFVRIGPDYVIPAGRGETREQLVEHALAAVERIVQSWGTPPEKFYWVPRLKFIVSPGGNQHAERLRTEFNQWGVASSVEQRLETSGQISE